ncbi:MAG: hypothetical protein ACOCYG_06085, partial [Spirochaetota bacterium]
RLLESLPHMSAAARPTAGSPAVESAIATLPELFGSDKLLDTTIIVAVGIVLYFLTVSKPGKSVAIRIERSAPEVRTVLVFFFIGLGVFGMFALL